MGKKVKSKSLRAFESVMLGLGLMFFGLCALAVTATTFTIVTAAVKGYCITKGIYEYNAEIIGLFASVIVLGSVVIAIFNFGDNK